MTSPALAAYLGFSRLAGPLARGILRRRMARGKEDPARIGERLGEAGADRPRGRLIWLHGASVGEAMSILPLVDAIRRAAPDVALLVTSGTVTSAARLAEALPEGAIHQFVPVDTAAAVRRFLDHWRPGLAIWVESEFWPRLMVETRRAGAPMMLVNARISERSARRWRHLPGMARDLVRLFDRILTQDRPTVDRLLALGADPSRLREGGNLKVLAGPPGVDTERLDRFQRVIGTRPVWLAASTHAPEEGEALAAHMTLAREFPGLLTIIAPRHPERAAELARQIAAQGVAVARRAEGALPDPETSVYLADTLGEMGLWMRLAPVAFIGGSIARKGGHNPFEPAALGSAILHGPRVENFAPAYAALAEAGAAVEVSDGQAMAAEVARLLAAPDVRRTMTDAARNVLDAMRPDVDALAAEALSLMRATA